MENRPLVIATALIGSIAIVGFATWSFGAFQAVKMRVGESLGQWGGFTFLWLTLNDMAIGLDRAFYRLELEPEVVDAVLSHERPEDEATKLRHRESGPAKKQEGDPCPVWLQKPIL